MRIARLVGHKMRLFIWCLPIGVLLCALPLRATSAAEEASLRLRIAWGGGAARQWLGAIRISEGTFSELLSLGLEPDGPGSIEIHNGAVHITQRSPRNYDGVDVLVSAPLHAKLTIELAPADQEEAVRRVEVPLSRLVSDFHNSELDDQNNRLLARRAPGDQLRVQFDRDSLVFSPGETFELEVAPHLLELAPDTQLRCSIQLLKARRDDEVWGEERDLRAAADGAVSPIGPLRIELPAAEGVYDVLLTLTKRRLTNPFIRPRPVAQRKLQLVVVDGKPRAPEAAKWQQVVEIDPAHPSRWERLVRLPQLKVIPGIGQGPLGNDAARAREHLGRTFLQIGAGGWQAYPLPISRMDEPHILEVEYPSDLKQTLGISIIEPNAAGVVAPIGLDSGVDVPESLTSVQPRVERHRLIFWPRTKTPLVLLVNRRTDVPAVFGRIRLLAGPTSLPSAPLPKGEDERLLATYFDKPLFPENFSADEAVDGWTNRTLDDWVTFHQGGRRLVEYLKHAGYNGAVIAVVCEGSAIYPSRLLEPTPKYDTGVFFDTGQDPTRKDVLEMLFRLFEREGLKLIPAVQFSTPLPELEKLRRRGGPEKEGIELIGGDGRTWLERNGTRRGLAPYYNPLDPHVQAAMRRVVQELTARYAHHRSFDGVSLQLGPTSYAQLPEEEWGYDDLTTARFEKDSGVSVPGRGDTRFAQRAAFFQGAGRKRWLNWRSAEVARLHHEIQEEMAAERPGVKLYLNGNDIFASRQVQNALRPSLVGQADVSDALLALGLDSKLYADRSEIVLLRPQRIAPLMSLHAQAADLELGRAPEVDRFFARGGRVGGLHYHEPLTLHMPSFDAVSPFGPENTQTWLVSHFSPAGHHSRRRFVQSVAALDPASIIDGGWMAPLGQEQAVRDVAALYRRLPAEPFQTASPSTPAAQRQPVIVRTLTRGQRTYVYLVNNSPWPLAVKVQLTASERCRLEPLSSRRLPDLEQQGGRTWWNLQLQPYDMAGAALTEPDVSVQDWQVTLSRAVWTELRQLVQETRARANALRNPAPLNSLLNPGFELPPQGPSPPGWVHAEGDDIAVAADPSHSRSGTHSLRIHSGGPVVWVRSEPFDSPQTGRLAVWVWLKIEEGAEQPPLRLAIEGRLNGQTYYRRANVGAGEHAPPIKSRWAPYMLQIDDLPPLGLTDLRVGFDLMGAGEVWIDDVQVFDLWFNDNERDELLKNIALADFHLGEGKVADCERFLDSYWPRFLRRHVPIEEPRVAELPPADSARPGPGSLDNIRTAEQEKPSMLDRLRGMAPKSMLPSIPFKKP